MHECIPTIASTIHFRADDFLLNNVTGNESWFHPKENCYIFKEAVVAVSGL
jgi:hypothetical protein